MKEWQVHLPSPQFRRANAGDASEPVTIQKELSFGWV
jgi:hypothetical protein